jgi:hypothetical protein
MVKTEDLPLIEIDLRGNRARISLKEDELSRNEWNHVKTSAFTRLRKDPFIPHELIDLVEHFKERTVVHLTVYRTGEALRFGIKAIGQKTKRTKRDTIRRLAELWATHTRIQSDKKTNAMTASEALAFFLRMSLRQLKHAERTRDAAPVRALQLMPRSLLAEIATHLFTSCKVWSYPPGPCLVALLRELLNIEGDKQGTSRRVDAQEQAIVIIAQMPTVSTHELARLVQVNASTISRWRRNPEFNARVNERRNKIALMNPKESGANPQPQNRRRKPHSIY